MSQFRQLAAIMFADIVGYTAMMEEDEQHAVMIKDKFKNKLVSELESHGGRLIKFSGDGALCSFNSAFEAVKAAIETQLAMLKPPIVNLRIGIHQADIVFDESDVYGDGVNIAARLESMAVPGSIFVSGKVIDDIKNQKEIQAHSLGRYVLKNIKEPIEVFAISNTGLKVPLHQKLEGKAEKYVDRSAVRRTKKIISWSLLVVVSLAIAGYALIDPWMKKQYARNELLPQIQRLVNDNFHPPTAAFDMAIKAEKILPKDSSLQNLWPIISSTATLETEPSGAEVWWKDYDKPTDEWRSAGTTPLSKIKFPRPYLRFEIRKKGYQTIEYSGPNLYARIWNDSTKLKLDQEGALPHNMIRVPKSLSRMNIVGLEHTGPKEVPEFLIDKYEVTCKLYKEFMDAGGYSKRNFWNNNIYVDDKEISLDEALKLFVDKTGRPGPATWEAGTYPDGQQNFPVTGISWYEAAAYAEFAKKQLPTIFHWGTIVETSRTQNIVPLSNFDGKSASPVGTNKGFSSFGVYDVAGNAREWCYNANNNKGMRYILGGGWNDHTYSFNDSYVQPAIDRSITNGFRCIKELSEDTSLAYLQNPVAMAFRDYKKEKPVDDKTFAIYAQQFLYDKTLLNSRSEETIDNELWTAEKITIDAGYNNERMQLWIYLPKNSHPPYQPIIYFPGSGDIFARTYDPNRTMIFDFIIKSGRAFIRPIYKGTFERHDELKSDLPDETVFYKDHLIMWRRDLGHAIDYLETRKDMQPDKLGYFGLSWGGYMGGILPALEKRIKAVVLAVGGMVMEKSLPEADQINFLPRVKQPVLMLNGKHDMFYPVESSQMPMFKFLGSAKEDKKIIIYDAGHIVPRSEYMKETLSWFDKYLGPVK